MKPNGTTEYTIGEVSLSVGFPNHEVKCRWCKYCTDDPSMRQRRRCFVSEEILYDIDRIGARCPLGFAQQESSR